MSINPEEFDFDEFDCDCCGSLSTDTAHDDGDGAPLDVFACAQCSRIAELEHKIRILTAERDKYSRLYFALKNAPGQPDGWPDDFDPRTDGDGLGVHNRD